MDIKGKVYRQGGQWKIVLQTEEWILEDMMRDSSHEVRTVLTVFDEAYLGFPSSGVSYRPVSYEPKTHLLGTLIFEEEANKKSGS